MKRIEKKKLCVSSQETKEIVLCEKCYERILSPNSNNTHLSANKASNDKPLCKKSNSKEHCWLCEGISDEFDQYVDLVVSALKKYEYSTFLIGTKIHESIQEREQYLIDLYQPTNKVTYLKNAINEYIGKIIEEKLKKVVDFKHPDIMVILDTTFNVISLQIKPLYIYGRYNKYDRNLPQTKWFCRKCKGNGCRYCEYSGKLYQDNVAELIAQPLLDVTKGTEAVFHGCGREDIDVRCLGNGRPFILEIKNPTLRTIDFINITRKINQKKRKRIAVRNLQYAAVSMIALLKEATYVKKYRVCISAPHPFSKEKLIKVAETLRGKILEQFTPQRVARRRANKLRHRIIYRCEIESVEENRAILTVTAASGTYIKEVITGDQGRTTPNISDLLGMSCHVDALDVIEIQGE